MFKHIVVLVLFLSAYVAQAQSVIGTWKTIDDATGKAKSHVQLYESNGKLYGKIIKLLERPADYACEKCPGERKGKLLTGMIIIEGLYEKGGFWQGGNILDPEKGRWYGCKVWLKSTDPNVLEVRGSFGPVYRTQNWYRL